jgi:hypothetical protein
VKETAAKWARGYFPFRSQAAQTSISRFKFRAEIASNSWMAARAELAKVGQAADERRNAGEGEIDRLRTAEIRSGEILWRRTSTCMQGDGRARRQAVAPKRRRLPYSVRVTFLSVIYMKCRCPIEKSQFLPDRNVTASGGRPAAGQGPMAATDHASAITNDTDAGSLSPIRCNSKPFQTHWISPTP